MPTKTATTKSEGRMRQRSKSPSRKRSRSRSKSRGRSKSPSRKAKQSPSPQRKSSRERKPREPRTPKTPSTPTRISQRLVEKLEKDTHPEEEVKITEQKDVSSRIKGGKAKKFDYEFGGPVGTFILTLGLPAVLVLLNLACSMKSCTLSKLPEIPRNLSAYFNRDAALIYGGWMLFQVVLANLPIGPLVEGQGKGKRFKYRCNGVLAFAVTVATFGLLAYLKYPVTKPYTVFQQLMSMAIVHAVLLSVFLCVKARKLSPSQVAPAGNSGCVSYNFFMGREMNPRIGKVDLKFFTKMRPGLLGWFMMNMVFISVGCHADGQPSYPLLLAAGLQAFYVMDALWFEDAILTTTDITTDGFGFMLSFGHLAWMPFMFTLQSRYLLEHPQQLHMAALGGCCLLFAIGYLIFRGANSQKDKFRKNPYDPSLAHLDTIPTSSGKKLLASGWWGLCRHPNYLGDLLMAVAWTIPCGFQSVVPWAYPIYLLVTLVHRVFRDDAQCRRKHGAAWSRYCERVKYRVIPYVF